MENFGGIKLIVCKFEIRSYPTNTSIRQYLYVCHSIRLSFDELIHSGAFNDIRKDAFELG